MDVYFQNVVTRSCNYASQVKLVNILFSEKKLEYNTVQLHVYKEEYTYA